MTIGEYLVGLAVIGLVVGALFVGAHALRGRWLLTIVCVIVVALGGVYYFVAARAINTVPTWKFTLILAIPASAAAIVVNLRSTQTRLPQRLLTCLAAAFTFALLWIPAAYVLR